MINNRVNTLTFYRACILLFVSSQAISADSSFNACSEEFENGSQPTLLQPIQRSASRGNKEAQLCLAELYLRGWGVEADESRAWTLFQQAAKAGSAEAMHRIGALYEQGIYVDQDYQQALHWHLRSAALGYAPAQSDVGLFYEDGLAGKKDRDKAVLWYKKAAAGDEPFAVEALQRIK